LLVCGPTPLTSSTTSRIFFELVADGLGDAAFEFGLVDLARDVVSQVLYLC